MAGRGTRATFDDFNQVRTYVLNVLGIGSGTKGYGQALASNAATAGDVISVAQWVNLRTDLSKSRVHQTNTLVVDGLASTGGNAGSPWQTLQLVTSSTAITEDIRNQYFLFARDGIDASNTTHAAAQLSSPTTPSGITNPITRVGSWGTPVGSLTSTSVSITLTWGGYGILSAADHMRCFFNAGGQVQLSFSRTGAAITTKDTDWTNLLSSFGTLTLTNTGSTVSGTVPSGGTYAGGASLPTSGYVNTATGYTGLSGTTTYLLCKNSTTYPTYAENRFYISATKTANTMTFTCLFSDNDAGDQIGIGAPLDELVTGTLNATLQVVSPTGANVSINAPTASAGAFAP